MILLEKFGALGGGAETLGGMVLMTPTSINYTGTSASIGANGSVTFTACSTLSLNGVFNTDYDNYLVDIRYNVSTSADIYARWRVAGVDASAANDYVSQYISASATTVGAGRITANTYAWLNWSNGTQRSGFDAFVYGPFLAQPTAIRSVTASDVSSAQIFDLVGTHDLSTSYDGMTLFPSSGNISGLLAVYGLVGT